MSYSDDSVSTLEFPFATLEYRDIADPNQVVVREAEERASSPQTRERAEVEMSEADFSARLRKERADAVAEIEQKLRQDYEQKLVAARLPIAEAVKKFDEQREGYFGKVEAEVVQLALSIAAKILHRESQVDPMLVATLVRMAVEKMHDGSKVKVRIGAGKAASWIGYFAQWPKLAQVEVAEDAKLSELDCMVETELGSANFGLDSQLKEVEKGFFDLLALRPAAR